MRRHVHLTRFMPIALILLATGAAWAGGTGSVRFVITDLSGEPVVDAEVCVWGDGDGHEARTGRDGTARIEGVPVGDWIAGAAAERYTAEETEIEVEAGGEIVVRLKLGPGVPVSGKIVDEAGRPVPDAYIEAIAGGSFEGYGEWKARPPYDRVFSGEDGVFRIRGIPDGSVTTLVVSADGFRETRVAARAQGGAVRPDPLVVTLDRGGVLAGVVLDPSGRPVPGALVHVVPADEPDIIANPRLRRWGNDGETVMAITVRAGADGRFSRSGLALGEPVVVLAEGPGLARSLPSDSLMPTAARREVRVSLRLRSPATLVLRVTAPDGTAVTAGKVRLGGTMSGLPSRSAPDAPGLFRFEGLAPGEYRVSIESPGWLPARERITLEAGRTTERTVALSAGATIAGVVRDEKGNPISGASVSLTREETREDGSWTSFTSGRTETDADGRFEIRGLAPGRHELSAFLPGICDLPEDLVVDAPKTDLVLTLRRMGVLRVRFAAPDGGPRLPERVFVWEHLASGAGSGSGHALTDGVLILRGFRGEEKRIQVQFGEFVPFRRTVRIDWGETLDLGTVQVDPGVTVAGRIVDLDGKPVRGALIRADGPREAVAAADGSFRLEHVAAGKTAVSVRATGFLTLATEIDAGGKAKPAAIRLRRGALVTGRLLDAEGRPLENYWIQFRRPPTSADEPKGEHLDETGTEEDGSFEVRLPAGPCRVLFITAEKIHVLATLDLEEAVDREVRLTLKP